jgi:hypothetical protein
MSKAYLPYSNLGGLHGIPFKAHKIALCEQSNMHSGMAKMNMVPEAPDGIKA